jgi:ABC-type multidrug transport system ATPase subunit
MTVRDHLAFFARLRNAPDVDGEVEQKIRLLDLEEVQNRLAGHCSGGYKRRLLAATSFISDPQMLFLDEPLSGVDVLAAHKFYQVLQAFSKGSAHKDLEQASSPVIVLTTHRIVEAEEMCSRIAIMRDGQFVVLGRINELVNRYCSGSEITLKPVPLDPVLLESEYETFRNEYPGDFTFQDLLTFCHLTSDDRLGTLFDKIQDFEEVHPLTKSATLEILGYAQEIKIFEFFLEALQDEAQIESAHIRLDSLIVTCKLSVNQALTLIQNSPISNEIQDYLVASINVSRVFKDIADGQLDLTI